MTRSLVTGAAGFLGSHLCDALLRKGHSVIGIDNLFCGDKRNVPDGVEFIRHDITIPILLEVDEIYHLACPASPVHYQRDPVRTMRTNVLGMINVLDLARTVGAKVLFTSTSEVYGDPEVHPQTEDYWGHVNPIGVRSCYDEGKRAAETLCVDYGRQYELDTKIVRLFNTYGPRMAENDGRVVSNFIVAALKGEPITVYGDGSQTRSFCYCEDTVDALIRMMERWEEGPINIGNPDERTILELAELIVSLTGSKSEIVFKELPQDDPIRRQPDITKAALDLDWTPCTDIKHGLTNTIFYFRRKMVS